MKAGVLALTLSALASQAYGHYIFQFLTVNGEKGAQYEHIRKNTNYNSPVTELSSTDLRCNVGGDSGANTETVSVAAGSEFTFTADTAVYHQGPVAFYMSAATPSAKEYDGSGEWFKIAEIGPSFSGGQATWDMSDNYSATIPAGVPDGEYLLRIEQLALHNPGAAPQVKTPYLVNAIFVFLKLIKYQFYISCAQIEVTGGGSGSPSPTAAIPGHISADDPGYTANIYNGLTEYTVPGPAVWSG
ncbi:hypothetical protein FQN54_002240 [Arachnomyces sp. PD_36]|nr:hypothetical protein FQN54_002240 [Arachnomyces sp. PD_36]